MRTQPITRDHRVQRRAKMQREIIITPILAEKHKKEKRKKDDCRILDSRRVSRA